jgi:hypothetical protein
MTRNLRVVVLQPTSQEYTDIAQKFTTSFGGTFTVVNVCICSNINMFTIALTSLFMHLTSEQVAYFFVALEALSIQCTTVH